MKKITALFLALIMILSAFTLVACDQGTEAPKDDNTPGTSGGDSTPGTSDSLYAIVSAAIDKTLKANSYDADLETAVKTDLMGYKTENSMTHNMKATGLDTDKPTSGVDGQAIIDGYAMDQVFYYDGEWKYFDITEDGGYKSRYTFDEFASDVCAPQTFLFELPEALFDGIQGTNNNDGSLSVTLTVDEATMETIYKDAITTIVYDVVGNDLNQVVTKDASITLTVADGYIRSYSVAFTCAITAGSDWVTFETSMSVDFISCDQDVTITAPANLENFYEMDWG